MVREKLKPSGILMDRADYDRLVRLRDAGALTDAEFAEQKTRLIRAELSSPTDDGEAKLSSRPSGGGYVLKAFETIYIIWAILVAFWWVFTDPESAPQQAALAGQALVLIGIPYTILAIVQRGRAIRAFE
jgi:hypothetical protein